MTAASATLCTVIGLAQEADLLAIGARVHADHVAILGHVDRLLNGRKCAAGTQAVVLVPAAGGIDVVRGQSPRHPDVAHSVILLAAVVERRSVRADARIQG